MVPATSLPAIIASRYRPIRLIATGGMGAVYEVEHTRTGEHLALKVLLSNVGSSTEAIERFKREARASARIRSDHVVRVTDADVAPELDGAPFLVMELLEGTDFERAATASPPAAELVVAWLRQVAQAIDKAHCLGIVHRDLKPENLFLATVEGGRAIVKVLDFGIAKMIEEGSGVTGSGQLLGTPRYMAPEQASSHARVTPATDRCALGLIAYRLLLGESYYQGGAMVILGQLVHDELQPPSLRGSRFGDGFDAWFMKACHRDPKQRFASASDQIEALAEVLGVAGIKVKASPAAIEGTGRRRLRGTRAAALWLTVGLFTAALLAGLVLHWGRGTGRSAPAASASPTVQSLPPPAPSLAAASPDRIPTPTSMPDAPGPSTGGSAAKSDHGVRGIDKPRSSRRHADSASSVPRPVPTPENPKAEKSDPYADQM